MCLCSRRKGGCYDLNIKCPPLAHVLMVWSPASSTNLSGGGNFRRWSPTGGSRSLGIHAFEECLDSGPFLSVPLYFLSIMS
jgi:hypothetical protein